MTVTGSVGHNNQLASIVQRIERLNDEKSEISEQIKDVFLEAKSNGFDVAALREIIRIRAKDQAKLSEHEAIVETYRTQLSMF